MNTRRQALLAHLEQHGAASYQEFSEQFNVSTMTIRRDVEALSAEGLVIKTLGGVQRAGAPLYYYESPLRSRMTLQLAEKSAIAKQSLTLIKPGETLFLDGSTTCLQLANQITEHKKNLTVVTNSALIAVELSKCSDNLVVGIGGQIDKTTTSFVGPSAEEQASRFFVDHAFFSTKGYVPAEGTFESSVGNLRVKQLIASQAGRVVLLVDHSKFGQRALSLALSEAQIHAVVTDDLAPEEHLSYLANRGKQVIVAQAKKPNKGQVQRAS